MTTGPESPVRDAALDAAWRAHSREEPPAHLDAAILGAAHDAVAAEPRGVRRGSARATSRQRWWMPLAAAAMISAVVIGVSRLASQDPAVMAPYPADLPARDAAPRDDLIPVEPPADAARVPELGAAAKRIPETPAPVVAVRPVPPPAPAPSVAFAPSPAERGPTPALGAVAPGEVTKSETTRAEPPSAPGARFAPSPPPAPAPRTQASPALAGELAAGSNALDAATPDADAWIARIRALYQEGKPAEAAQELVALRAAVPDADRRLPPELQTWAATVEP